MGLDLILREIGKPTISPDLELPVKGLAKYIEDVQLPLVCYCAFVRSPYAHARILSVDKKEAESRSGVIAVFTAEDLRAVAKPLEISYPFTAGKKLTLSALAEGKVRFAGEAMAVVVAEDEYTANDAAGDVVVEYEPLECVVDADQAMKADSPRLYEEWGNNLYAKVSFSTKGIDEAFARSFVVLKKRFKVHRHSAMPIETKGCLSAFDPATKSLTVWMTTQGVFGVQEYLSEMLELPEESIRVIAPRIGGSFGIKTGINPEEAAVVAASIKLERPVRWIESRTEHIQTSGQAREQTHTVEVGVSKEGRILAIRDSLVGDMGAGTANYPESGIITFLVSAGDLLGPYDVGQYAYNVYFVATNKCPFSAYRGFGAPEAALVMERIMDWVARELKLDVVGVRLANIVRPSQLPYVSTLGRLYDSGTFEESLRLCAEKIGYSEVRRRQAVSAASSKLVGVGFACAVKPCAVGKWLKAETKEHGTLKTQGVYAVADSASLTMDPEGGVTVRLGHSSMGTGLDTAVKQVVAEKLGLRLDKIKVILSDTSVCPRSPGSWASRSAIVCGAAASSAAEKLRKKMTEIAAHLLEVKAGDLELSSGAFTVKRSPDKRIPIEGIAYVAYNEPHRLPEGVEPGLEEFGTFNPPSVSPFPDKDGRINHAAAYSNSTHAAVVQVDTETGMFEILKYVIVYDGGVVINPAIAKGQIVGGAVQGIGGTLYERIVYDEQGNLLTSTLMDYLIPSSVETPRIEVHRLESRAAHVPGGFKGVGELGITPAYGAVANAVEDALAPLGVNIVETPITPEALWSMMRRAREAPVSGRVS